MDINEIFIYWIPLGFSVAGSAILVYGGIRAFYQTIYSEIKKEHLFYADIRMDFTSKITLALEFFIAGDLIKTIAEPTFSQITTLAVIVTIRTVIGYFLDRESEELKKTLQENQ